MNNQFKTVLNDRHVGLGAQMVEFGGWNMPIQYPQGIVQEHLTTRRHAGLFDVSHMGRFTLRGRNALPFLQHVLSNNAAGLEEGESQYTLIPNENGGALDDAYLYRFYADEYLLVVNASNRLKDWDHFQSHLTAFDDVMLRDITSDMSMLSLQGPESKDILLKLLDTDTLPDPMRNTLGITSIQGKKVLIARTGYTGEPLCFELFIDSADTPRIWDLLIAQGAHPVGLGARDTLRLEAGLPLYGHELGLDPDEQEIPIFASPLSRFAVSLSPLKKDFIGREALTKQFEALKQIMDQDYTNVDDLPRRIMPVALKKKAVARAGYKIFQDNRHVGYITSGTMVPRWEIEGEGIFSKLTQNHELRGICLALMDSTLLEGDDIDIEIRSKHAPAIIVPYHLRSEAPPFARSIPWDELDLTAGSAAGDDILKSAHSLVDNAIRNTTWRQTECINLIPSEQTQSSLVRWLSIMDPSGRYAEHKQVGAFSEAEVFYYQGTDFIAQVEEKLEAELQRFFGCHQVETRLVSGQMANMALFSAMLDYINRADRKSEQRRLRKVLNNHIIRGGHLSAQPMGALRDFVSRDPLSEKAAVVNLPVLPENPYCIDLDACEAIIERHKPELIIFGKSMVLHKEPVAEVRGMIDRMGIDAVIMYDMAHVLGLVGPHFQEPFKEGADFITGSSHKTFFGTQRGIIASDVAESDTKFELWEAVKRRAFPGSVSNHHLGTLLGLLMAAYEMNHFKDQYPKRVIDNARTFAKALSDCGLNVAGDPEISFTETHQVILNVGYAKGPEIARRLEDNNLIVNYQAAPADEGFTASGSLRMGVQEMTRFGMQAEDFEQLAQYFKDVLLEGRDVKEAVASFRKNFLEMQYCFSRDQFENEIQQLHKLL
jgi:glycine cleavage system T protein